MTTQFSYYNVLLVYTEMLYSIIFYCQQTLYSHIFQSLCCDDGLAHGSCWLFSTPEDSHRISFKIIQRC